MSLEHKGLRGIVASWKRILALSRKPDRDEFKLLLRLTFLALALIGSIAYLVHLVATVIVPAIAG